MISMVNLCKLFNKKGHKCNLYFPGGEFYANSKSIFDFKPEKNDIIISNDIATSSISDLNKIKKYFLKQNQKIKSYRKIINFFKFYLDIKKSPFKKFILSIFDDKFLIDKRKKTKLSLFDHIHVSGNSMLDLNKGNKVFYLPHPIESLKESTKKNKNIAAILDEIKKSNKIEKSIKSALDDKMKKVIIYSHIQDPVYFYNKITPLMEKYPKQVLFAGFVSDRQELYDSVSDVYSNSDDIFLLESECKATNTKLHSKKKSSKTLSSNDEIYKIWQQKLGL